MSGKKVLITGMSGLIGGIVRREIEGDYELRALNRGDMPDVECFRADIADLNAMQPAFEGVDSVVHLAAGDRASRRMEYTFHRRGLHRLRGFRVSTRFPFGLFLKSYRLKDNAEVLVYPRLAGEPPPRGSHPASQGDRSGQRTGLDGDFRGLRDFAEGEDARRIHWKTSARRDQLVAVERSDGNRERATVHLLPGAVPATAPNFADDFERQVSQAARAACDLLAAGHEVGLLTPAGCLAPRAGLAQRREVLRHLAVIPTPQTPLTARLSTLRGQLGGHDVVVA